VTLYKHTDGYPGNIIPRLIEAYQLATAPMRFGSQSYDKKWEAGRAGKVAGYICATHPGSFEPEAGHQLHGDIQFYYRLYLVNTAEGSMAEDPKWEVEIYIPSDELANQLLGGLDYSSPNVSLEMIQDAFDQLYQLENMSLLLERTPLFEVELSALERQIYGDDYEDEDDFGDVETVGTVDTDDLDKLFDEIDSITEDEK
jgi:hypothetical protein